MDKESVYKKLKSVKDLPSLPIVVQKIRQSLSDSNTNAESISLILKDDPAMSSKILRVANSAVFGLPQKVESVNQAIAILGFSAIGNIAMTASVFSSFSKGNRDFDRREFWRHSISVGFGMTAVYELSKESLGKKYSKDVLHLAGLLHDMGKMVFDEFFHTDFIEAVKLARKDATPLFHAEREVFGLDHAELGAWLGAKWNLNDEVVHAIRYHHEIDEARDHVELVNLCHTANHACNLHNCGDGGDLASPFFKMGILKKLGMKVKDIRIISEEVKEEAKHSEILLALAS